MWNLLLEALSYDRTWNWVFAVVFLWHFLIIDAYSVIRKKKSCQILTVDLLGHGVKLRWVSTLEENWLRLGRCDHRAVSSGVNGWFEQMEWKHNPYMCPIRIKPHWAQWDLCPGKCSEHCSLSQPLQFLFRSTLWWHPVVLIIHWISMRKHMKTNQDGKILTI